MVMETNTETSIRLLDGYLNQKIQVIAFGTAYCGILLKVDYDRGILVLADETDQVTLDLAHVESYANMD